MGQGGNAFELLESAFDGINDFDDPDDVRVARGGSYTSSTNATTLLKGTRTFIEANKIYTGADTFGFRVAKVYDRFTSEFGMNLTDNTGITYLALGSGYNTKHTLNLRGCTNLTGFYSLYPKTLTISGVNDWSDCNFSEGQILNIAEFVKGDPANSASANQVKLGGNPIWVSGLTSQIIATALANNFTFVE